MIDLRNTYCKLDSKYIEQYKGLIREQGLISIGGNYVDDMILNDPPMYLTVNNVNVPHCASKSFRETLGRTEFKGIKEGSDTKHPHHDLIVEWAKDVSKSLQCYMENAEVWVECYINPVISDTVNDYKFRIKPEREFIKGHWYPCIYEKMEGVIKCTGDNTFISKTVASGKFTPNDFEWIGESLGDIKFGYFE